MKVVRNFTLVKRHAENCSKLGWVLQVIWVIIVDTIKFVVILKTRARIEFVQKVLNSVSHILDMSLPLKVNKILTACKPTFLDYWLIKNTNIPIISRRIANIAMKFSKIISRFKNIIRNVRSNKMNER